VTPASIAKPISVDSFGEIRQITCHFATHSARHQARLHKGYNTDRQFHVKQWVGNFFLLALLPGGDHGASPFVVEQKRTAFAFVEIARAELATVDQGERQAIGQR